MLSKRKNINRTINIAFVIYVLVVFFFNAFTIMIGEGGGLPSIAEMQEAGLMNVLFFFGMIFMVSLFFILFQHGFIIVLFIGAKMGMKFAYKDKLDKIDFGKYQGTYRNIIHDYSPAVLSYIDDFDIKSNKDILATLFHLKQHGHIKIEDNEVIVINPNTDGLEANEKYVLETKGNVNMTTFEYLAAQDALEHGLIERVSEVRSNRGKNFIVFLIIAIILGVLATISVELLPEGLFKNIMQLVLFLGTVLVTISIFVMPVFIMSYGISYGVAKAMNPYMRTEKGNEINQKLEGLKNYIKNYSLLDQRSKDELALWDDYLIYSIMFNINTTIIKEFE